MKRTLSIVSSALVGIVFGALSNYSILVLFSWFNLGVWALVGLLIGAFIEEKRFITWAGISYGFFVTVSFLVTGFHGSSNVISAFITLSFILGSIGALCGLVLVFLGNWTKTKFRA